MATHQLHARRHAGIFSEIYHELEEALSEVKEGKITYIDPDNLWKSI